ncbi:gp74 [Brochothrix phage A9]|uniref:Gp74 n=1 Tax=Brochothrix phage A9 TaxID=857312 RepID=D9J0M1_9CAUD|nr:gp74 [Brochothrix phage A9]ADJ53114.1 gp74 [Brochothrix phage A9]
MMTYKEYEIMQINMLANLPYTRIRHINKSHSENKSHLCVNCGAELTKFYYSTASYKVNIPFKIVYTDTFLYLAVCSDTKGCYQRYCERIDNNVNG